MEIKWVAKNYGQLSKFDNLDEMDQFFERHLSEFTDLYLSRFRFIKVN